MSPRTLAVKMDATASAVYLDEESVYVLRSGREVLRVSKTAGTPPEALPIVCKGGNVVADATHVYVIDVAGKCISRCAKQAGARAEVLATGIALSGMGVDATSHVYFTSNTSICRIAKAGGRPELVLDADEPELLAVHEGTVYFTTGSFFDESVRAFALAPGRAEPREISVGGAMPGTVRFVAGSFYVLDEAGVLSAIDPSTGVRRVVRSIPRERRPFLTMSSRYVYVGDIGRAKLEGGPLETVEVGRIIQSKIDESGIAWLEASDGGVTLRFWD